MLKVVRYHGEAFKNESENIKFLSKIFVKWQKNRSKNIPIQIAQIAVFRHSKSKAGLPLTDTEGKAQQNRQCRSCTEGKR